ncbi:hypothetical protein EVAR_84051_1 [Eumeta japonica]|uniref:Uncharacterized protein n=1 Tax=Eumeta variegata TaxID=151549 RepID=A0A4C1ZYY5_EUMVA|nr:hypothetical protein EVAR_84051_1 [Eumeta japonica]
MTDITDYIARLRSFVRKLQPSPASRHGERATFVYKDLAATTHVFLREDTIRSSFQPAYTGPHEGKIGDPSTRMSVGQPGGLRPAPHHKLSDSSGGPLPLCHPTLLSITSIPLLLLYSCIHSPRFRLHQSSVNYPIPTQEAGNALVTPLGLHVYMGCDDHLLSGRPPARYSFDYAINKN